jgi:hypothetical protein
MTRLTTAGDGTDVQGGRQRCLGLPQLTSCLPNIDVTCGLKRERKGKEGKTREKEAACTDLENMILHKIIRGI